MRLQADALVCDLDGVVYRGDHPVPGAPEAVASLRAAGVRVLFCTNNSRPTLADYVAKLERMGIDAGEDDVVTSAVVTAVEARLRGFVGRAAYVVGGEGIRAALRGEGIEVLAAEAEPGSAALVVVGWDPDLTYDRLRRASTAVRNGAEFLATNADATYPMSGGEEWPGGGAILAAVETAAGRRAAVMGKPHPPTAREIERRLEPGARIAVVGDRPETDLALGAPRGWTTILVLTGVTAREDVDRSDPRPDVVVGSLAEIGAPK